MRKTVIAIIVTMFLFFVFLWYPHKAPACTLKLTPSAFSAPAGETLIFHLERYPTHRQCVLPLEETKITVSGGKLFDPGVWKRGTPDVLDFKVIFDQPGHAVVRVERNCPKEGLIFIEASGTVKAASSSAASPPPPAAPAAVEPKPVSTEGLSTAPAGSQDTSQDILKPKANSTVSWTDKSLNLILWFSFIITGLAAYLLKLTSLRRPLLFLSLIILGFYLGGCPEPVGAPFYILSHNQALLGTALFLLILPLAVSIIWGRVFCGWVCPLGTVQELIHAGQSHTKISLNVPYKADKTLKLMKFATLIVFGHLSWQTSHNAFSSYDPFKVLFNFSGTPLTVTLLILTLLASVFLSRPFCRYLCPLGALFTITARLSLFAVRLHRESCNRCGLCTKKNVCPLGAISAGEGASPWPRVDAGECIMCRNCEITCRRSALAVFRRLL